MKSPIKALVVDDERLARKDLITLLQEHGQIEVVGEADDVESAAQAVEHHNPDVIFLDIQIKPHDGYKMGLFVRRTRSGRRFRWR